MNAVYRRAGLLLTAWLLLFFPTQVQASHAMGADLEYVCLGGNTYEFTFAFYRDCAGITAPTSIVLNLNSPTCGASATVTLTQQGTGTEVSPLCTSQLSNSSCSGGTLPGVEQYLYTATYTLPQNCPDWTASWTTCCRNSLITNLVNPASEGMYIFAELDNSGGLCNSSPSFTTLPVPFICDGQQFCYNHGAVDPDGDSLAYTLIDALDGPYPGVPLVYAAPNSATYPVTTLSGSVAFDPLSGTMCVTPSGPQVSVVAIRVDEYRNGVLIGSTMRDIQVVVRACSNQQPTMVNNGIYNHNGGVQIDSNSVESCPGDPIFFNVQFDDLNAADNITVLTNLASTIPGATFNISGTNPVVGTFSWTPGAADIGFHNFTITVQDDGCPILGSQVYSFDIQILGGTYVGPDQPYCPAGSPVQINTNGGSVFTWTTISGDPTGLSCNSCQDPQASPVVTSTYMVQSNLSGTCRNRDTITINVVPDFLIDAGNDTSICKYATAAINGSLSPVAFAPYTFTWSPTDSLSNPSSLSLFADPEETTTYYLTATSALGCTLTDSVTIDIFGVAPLVIIPPVDTICPGTAIPLSPNITYECDTTSLPCTGPLTTGTITDGTSSTSTYGPGYMVTTTAYSIRRQYIYTPAELNALGYTGGRLESIGMNFTTANSNIANVRIAMGCSDQSSFDLAPYSFITGLTEVKAPFTITPALGWNDFVLDYPYNWDGVSNLVVEICTDNTNLGTSSNTEYGCLTGGRYPTLYYNLAAQGACQVVTGTRTTCRPSMRFQFCSALPTGLSYTWTPSTNLSSSTSSNPTATPPSTTSYLLSVDDGSGCVGSSQTTLVIDSAVYVAASASDPTPCGGQSVTLNSNVTGQALPPQLSACGVNGTTCTQPTTTYTVGNGTFASSTYGPYYGGTYTDVKYQFLFTAAELQAAGVPSGTMTELAWNVITKTSTTPFQDMQISMGCTSDGNLSTTTGWLPTNLVWGPYDYNTVVGWNTVLLDNAFDWDGTSNVVVEVCFNNPNNTTTASDNVEYASGMGHTAAMRNYVSTTGANGCALTPSFSYTARCNMQFTVCPPPPLPFTYLWSPSTGLSDPTVPNPTLNYSGPQVYTLTVSGGRCPVTDTVELTDCGLLPAGALVLYGEAAEGQGRLRWETENESQTSHFLLERSGNGVDFERLARHGAAGQSQGQLVYHETDLAPLPGLNFYRVRLVDLNGQSQLSNVVELYFDGGEGLLALYPNPVRGGAGLHLDYLSGEGGTLDLAWTDALGRTVHRSRHPLQSGLNRLDLSTQDLAKGVYFLRMAHQGRLDVQKVVLQD